jgi:hypothetical protein
MWKEMKGVIEGLLDETLIKPGFPVSRFPFAFLCPLPVINEILCPRHLPKTSLWGLRGDSPQKRGFAQNDRWLFTQASVSGALLCICLSTTVLFIHCQVNHGQNGH